MLYLKASAPPLPSAAIAGVTGWKEWYTNQHRPQQAVLLQWGHLCHRQCWDRKTAPGPTHSECPAGEVHPLFSPAISMLLVAASDDL